MAASGAERVLDDWATTWSSRDTERLLSRFTEDCVAEDVAFGIVIRGKEELRAFADGFFASIPDFEIELTAGFLAGSLAGMEYVMSGTHNGDFPGMPTTGKRFSVRGVAILEFRAGYIRRESIYRDAASVMRQVGLLPSQ